jgi:hypothetical protein
VLTMSPISKLKSYFDSASANSSYVNSTPCNGLSSALYHLSSAASCLHTTFNFTQIPLELTELYETLIFPTEKT